MAPLPGTAKEGIEVAELIRGRLLQHGEATADAVKAKRSPKVIHLATHAYFLPDLETDQASVPMAGMTSLGSMPGLKASSLPNESPLLRSGIVLAG